MILVFLAASATVPLKARPYGERGMDINYEVTLYFYEAIPDSCRRCRMASQCCVQEFNLQGLNRDPFR